MNRSSSKKTDSVPGATRDSVRAMNSWMSTTRASSTHKRYLMLGIKLIKIHEPLPGKREHDGLSVKDAYIAMPLICPI